MNKLAGNEKVSLYLLVALAKNALIWKEGHEGKSSLEVPVVVGVDSTVGKFP